MASAILAGCVSASGTLHEEFFSFNLKRIAVPPPANDTILPLDDVSFGGLLQQALLIRQTINVPVEIQRKVQEELERKGYETTSDADGNGKHRQPLPEGAEAPPYDAVLYTTIETWHATSSPIGVKTRWRFEMYHVPTAALLYEVVYLVRAGGSRDTPPDFFKWALNTSIERALLRLPPRG